MEAGPLGWASGLFSSFTCCEKDIKERVIITQQPAEHVTGPFAAEETELLASAVVSAVRAAKDTSPVASMGRRGSFSGKDVDHAKQALSKARERLEHAQIMLDRPNEVMRQLSQQLTQVRGLQGPEGCFHLVLPV